MKFVMKRFVLPLVALLCVANANATTVNFDSIIGFQFVGPVYSESGFQFSNNTGGTYGLLAWGQGSSYDADPNGNTLNHNYGGSTTTLTKIGNGPFSLNSIDLADVYNNNAGNSGVGGDILFSFLFADSSTSSQTVTIDGNPGLQTFSFNLSNLLSVAWTPQT